MKLEYNAKVGYDQEMVQSERYSHSINRGGKNKVNNQVLILRKHIVSRLISYFPNRQSLIYSNLFKIR